MRIAFGFTKRGTGVKKPVRGDLKTIIMMMMIIIIIIPLKC
jgi:hypothetical protein